MKNSMFEKFAKSKALKKNIDLGSVFFSEAEILDTNLTLLKNTQILAEKLDASGYTRNHEVENEVRSTLSNLLDTMRRNVHSVTSPSKEWSKIFKNHSESNPSILKIKELIQAPKHSIEFIKQLCDRNNLAYVPYKYLKCAPGATASYYNSKTIKLGDIYPNLKPDDYELYCVAEFDNVSLESIFKDYKNGVAVLPIYAGAITDTLNAFFTALPALSFAIDENAELEQVRAAESLIANMYPSYLSQKHYVVLGYWLTNVKNSNIVDGLIYIPCSLAHKNNLDIKWDETKLNLEFNQEKVSKKEFVLLNKKERVKQVTLYGLKNPITLSGGLSENVRKKLIRIR